MGVDFSEPGGVNGSLKSLIGGTIREGSQTASGFSAPGCPPKAQRLKDAGLTPPTHAACASQGLGPAVGIKCHRQGSSQPLRPGLRKHRLAGVMAFLLGWVSKLTMSSTCQRYATDSARARHRQGPATLAGLGPPYGEGLRPPGEQIIRPSCPGNSTPCVALSGCLRPSEVVGTAELGWSRDLEQPWQTFPSSLVRSVFNHIPHFTLQ